MLSKVDRKPLKHLRGVEEIKFINYASSWGRITCIIEVDGGNNHYQSWAGDPREEVTTELLLDALALAIEVCKAVIAEVIVFKSFSSVSLTPKSTNSCSAFERVAK